MIIPDSRICANKAWLVRLFSSTKSIRYGLFKSSSSIRSVAMRSGFGVEIDRSMSDPLRKFPVAREPNRVTFSMSGYFEKVSDIFCNKFVGMPNWERVIGWTVFLLVG